MLFRSEELRNKYIQNPPEGMTAKLVKSMSDADLLDMHYFLLKMMTGMAKNPKKVSISTSFSNRLVLVPA